MLIRNTLAELHARIDARHATLLARCRAEEAATLAWLRERHAFYGRSSGQLRRFARERAGLV